MSDSMDGMFRDLISRMDDFDSEVFSLTVSESKRLIARGLTEDERVQSAMAEGMVAVCKGTTNGYVLEELLGRDVDKAKYVLGRTIPAGDDRAQRVFEGSIPEVVFNHGEPVEGLTVAEAVHQMSAGDVVLKGANALDYGNSSAAVLIGHPEGGTMASIIGCVYGKGLELIIPVGLEKQVATPIAVAEGMAVPALCADIDAPRFWPIRGSLFTEIEALDALADVMTIQLGSGGVCGAEGAVWLMVSGPTAAVEAARDTIEGIRGEPSFLDAAGQ